MLSNFIARVAPFLLGMMAASGIARPRRPRLVSYGGPPAHYDLQGTGRTLVRASEKQGRNEPCSCGSGQKFKKCCGG